MERNKTDKATESCLRRSEALAALGAGALRGFDLPSAIKKSISTVTQGLDVEYCKVLKYLPNDESFILRDGAGWEKGVVGNEVVKAGNGSPAGFALSCNRPVVVNNVEGEKRFEIPPTLLEHGVSSAVGVLIYGHDEPFGVLEAFSSSPREFTRGEVNFLQTVSNFLAQAIERDRVEEALKRSETNLAKAQELVHLGSFEFNTTPPHEMHWSEETFRILGRSPGEEESSPEDYFEKVVYPDDRALVRKAYEGAIKSISPHEIEYRILRPDGKIRHVRSVSAVQLKCGRGILKVTGTLLDITDQKKLEADILHISEVEKRTIGFDLHDGLCQQLAGIALLSQSLEKSLSGVSKRLTKESAEITRLLKQSIDEVRSLANGLSPVPLEENGLMDALQKLAVNTHEMFDVTCSFACEKPVSVHDSLVATHLFRIAQEAVNNAIRHGKANVIGIVLARTSDRIILEIDDDGMGFDVETASNGGLGLRTMKYRARLIKASLVFQRKPKGGMVVVCSVVQRERKTD